MGRHRMKIVKSQRAASLVESSIIIVTLLLAAAPALPQVSFAINGAFCKAVAGIKDGNLYPTYQINAQTGRGECLRFAFNPLPGNRYF